VSGKGTPATKVLDDAGVAYRVHEYVHDPLVTNFGQEAADALGVDIALVHKTLLVQIDRNGRPEFVVGIVPVNTTLDLKAIAAAVGVKKAEMAKPTDAERITGYVVGGISPLGQRRLLRTVIDEDAEIYDTIFVSGGRRGLDLELAGPDLAKLTDATFAPIAVR
jgi:Cys-tRNA(Pro)/Cys-tRNA(Cys) deacylase